MTKRGQKFGLKIEMFLGLYVKKIIEKNRVENR